MAPPKGAVPRTYQDYASCVTQWRTGVCDCKVMSCVKETGSFLITSETQQLRVSSEQERKRGGERERERDWQVHVLYGYADREGH